MAVALVKSNVSLKNLVTQALVSEKVSFVVCRQVNGVFVDTILVSGVALQ